MTALTLLSQALRMTLQQLQETDTSPGKAEYSACCSRLPKAVTNPRLARPRAAWLYQFAVANPPSDATAFMRALLKERQDFGERLLKQVGESERRAWRTN